LKIIVFSDSHGNPRNMEEVMKRHRTADCFFHLGDGIKEFENLRNSYPETAFINAVGNCDELGLYPTAKRQPPDNIIELDGFRFLLTHGHRTHVKTGLSELLIYGRENNADVILFGHTHQKYYEYIPESDSSKPMYLFNPGSISKPVDIMPSFGVIEIKNGNILFSNADLKI